MDDDHTSDDYNRVVFGFIADLRGGVPECCDFCGEAYAEGVRWPIPEEAGEWTCNVCVEKWGGQE